MQSFESKRIHRSLLKNAPYNPRVISDSERARLKAGVKRHGLVEPLVWNKRTGNIVGGHQRLDIVDQLAATHNYLIDVSVIDVDLPREKELNVLLNNPDAQGDWDLSKLSEIFKDKDVMLAGTGFDTGDIYRLFGDTPLLSREEDLEQYAAKVEKGREGFEKAKAFVVERNSTMFYMVVVFNGLYDFDDFLDKTKLRGSRWQSGSDLRRLCSLEPFQMEQPKPPIAPVEGKKFSFRKLPLKAPITEAD